ncbi:hypothetical protein ACE6H2_018950 [Prunus campanulata]
MRHNPTKTYRQITDDLQYPNYNTQKLPRKNPTRTIPRLFTSENLTIYKTSQVPPIHEDYPKTASSLQQKSGRKTMHHSLDNDPWTSFFRSEDR